MTQPSDEGRSAADLARLLIPPAVVIFGHAVALALNTRPRKTLGWRNPAEAFDQLLTSAQQGGVATTG